MSEARLIDDHILATGDYRPLLPLLVRHKGWQGFKQRFALKWAYWGRAQKPTPQQEIYWQKIDHALGFRVVSAILVSADQLQTRWTGIARTDQQTYAVRLYHSHDDAYHEYTQTKLVEQYFMGPFVIPHVVNCQDGVLVADIIARKRRVERDDAVMDRLQYHTAQAITNCTNFKVPRDIVPLNHPGLFIKLENSTLVRQVKEWLAAHPDQLPIIPIHGDMTPWNITVDMHERLVLTSFERAGWHVPFYDVLHYRLQPLALQANAPPLEKLLDDMPWSEYPWLKQALVLYLIDQLCCDLEDLYDKQYHDPWLVPMVRNKEKWLSEALIACAD